MPLTCETLPASFTKIDVRCEGSEGYYYNISFRLLILLTNDRTTYLAVSPSFSVRFFMTLFIFGSPQVLPAETQVIY